MKKDIIKETIDKISLAGFDIENLCINENTVTVTFNIGDKSQQVPTPEIISVDSTAKIPTIEEQATVPIVEESPVVEITPVTETVPAPAPIVEATPAPAIEPTPTMGMGQVESVTTQPAQPAQPEVQQGTPASTVANWIM